MNFAAFAEKGVLYNPGLSDQRLRGSRGYFPPKYVFRIIYLYFFEGGLMLRPAPAGAVIMLEWGACIGRAYDDDNLMMVQLW